MFLRYNISVTKRGKHNSNKHDKILQKHVHDNKTTYYWWYEHYNFIHPWYNILLVHIQETPMVNYVILTNVYDYKRYWLCSLVSCFSGSLSVAACTTTGSLRPLTFTEKMHAWYCTPGSKPPTLNRGTGAVVFTLSAWLSVSRTSTANDCGSPPLKPSLQRTENDVMDVFATVQLWTWSGRPGNNWFEMKQQTSKLLAKMRFHIHKCC